MKKTDRTSRILTVLIGSLLILGGLFMVAAIIPSKLSVEESKNYPTYFDNLSEKRLLRTSFRTSYSELERIDVLFKNPNLESRDELKIRILKTDGTEVVQKDFSGFNLGDTSHARVDLPKGVVYGENLVVEVVMTKYVDGKLMVGTKNEVVNIIQYYDSNSVSAVMTRLVDIMSKVMSQPIVLLLPLAVSVLAVW
ncbi:hypothetical protein HYV64_02710 [Candidatus Shapirobacteria bacterium]|nr:hypothetical protein [Candidatus Shapirobacteria bacterium]